MDALLAELTAICGPDQVLTDPDVTAGYATDWTRRFRGLARYVIRPGGVDEVAAGGIPARGGTPHPRGTPPATPPKAHPGETPLG